LTYYGSGFCVVRNLFFHGHSRLLLVSYSSPFWPLLSSTVRMCLHLLLDIFHNERNLERRCLMHRNELALNGQVALVTGASSGLGRATALALAQAGADVALLARSADDLQEVSTALTSSGRRAVAFPGDLAHEDYIVNAAAQTIETFGRIDILVNAAGIDTPGAVIHLATNEWDYVLDVNLRAPFLLAKAVFPHMSRARRGTIINISSVAGKRGWANASAYCASKFGLTGFTQALAAEGKAYGIRACIIYPGGMATHWGIWTSTERPVSQREFPPVTKALPPAEVASLIVWISAAPAELVLNEAIISPLQEEGWP
jgi:NAD(P)-dependent dehydrogenase (short-subunit alcohol dehydrogenase family)